MKKYYDIENGEYITLKELIEEYEALQDEDPDTYCYSFYEYLENCLSIDGTLEEVYE